jgi:DNA-binding IclR family transcriptional regulator
MPLDDTSSSQVLKTFGEKGARTHARFTIFASSGVRDPQTASLSTPVFGDGGQLFGSLTLSGPIHRFGAVETTRMTQQLQDAATHLTGVLGGKMRASATQEA